METHERYFGKILAALVKQLVEEDESSSSHVDYHTIFAKLLSEQTLPKRTKPDGVMSSHYATNDFNRR